MWKVWLHVWFILTSFILISSYARLEPAITGFYLIGCSRLHSGFSVFVHSSWAVDTIPRMPCKPSDKRPKDSTTSNSFLLKSVPFAPKCCPASWLSDLFLISNLWARCEQEWFSSVLLRSTFPAPYWWGLFVMLQEKRGVFFQSFPVWTEGNSLF